jgi:DNA-binding CsgD family transcriptional regulator
MLARMSPDDGRPLTTLEEHVALLVATGRTTGEVAAELGLTEKTVEWHLARAARKLGVRSRRSMAAGLTQRAGGPRKEEQ